MKNPLEMLLSGRTPAARSTSSGWQKPLIISATVLIIVVILVIVIVTMIKRRRQATVALPQDTDWGRSLTDVEASDVQRIASALYQDMKGANVFSRNVDIYTEYAATSDRVFVGVANYFAEKYGDGENLAQWMDSEYYGWTSIECKGKVQAIMSRLASHGITA